MTRNVAIIAVHGVADQKLGATVQSIADLLVVQKPNGREYAPALRSDVTIAVPPLAPIGAHLRTDHRWKQFRQSIGSDFLRREWQSHGARRALSEKVALLTAGAEFTEYLLAKAEQNQILTEAYTAPLLRLRGAAGDAERVHLWEMYWADLSRLSGGVPRILTELFTLLFRLSALGRDTVRTAAASYPGQKAWRALSWAQTSLDWMYSRVLALLFLQLIMLALVMVPLALVSPHREVVHWLAGVSIGGAVGLLTFYKKRRWTLAVLTGALASVLALALPAALSVGIAWLLILGFCYDWWMRVCDERFPLVRLVGWTMWGVVTAIVVAVAATHATQTLEMWITGALVAVEVVLRGIVLWWLVAAPLMVFWLVAGHFAARGARDIAADGDVLAPFQARASVATGRMGLMLSSGFFLILAMSAWALLSSGVQLAVGGFAYCPASFIYSARPCTESLSPTPVIGTAAYFLRDRFENSTEAFSMTALLLSALVLYLTVVLVPSALAEIEVANLSARRLGKWLTGGYRQLDRMIAAIAWSGVALAVVTAIILGASWFGGTRIISALAFLATLSSELSREFLKPFVLTAASATLALSAAGGLLSRYVPWLRAPLDAALDVDNHFREFPRKAIPRVRIFSRFVAILDHVERQGYDDIVIVSHSQGTVLATELLRYLQERAADASTRADDRAKALWERVQPKISLITAGCPLRQLYASRFPVLYDWVLRGGGQDAMGPRAVDVGARRWVNVYATGDYIGRWIWTRPAARGDAGLGLIDDGIDGNKDVYERTSVQASDRDALMRQATERDVGIGAGAHTHYFDTTQDEMAIVIDALSARSA